LSTPLSLGRSLVAIDDAKRDDDRHAAEADQCQHQPAVLEAPRYDATEEQWGITPTAGAGIVLADRTLCRPTS